MSNTASLKKEYVERIAPALKAGIDHRQCQPCGDQYL